MTDIDSVDIPKDLRYTKTSEYVRLEGDLAIIGLSDYAQKELTDIVFVELPEVGQSIQAGSTCGNVESVKAVSDVYAPVNGEVVEVNEALRDTPELINKDPYGQGWFAKVKVASKDDVGALMDPDAYLTHLKTQPQH